MAPILKSITHNLLSLRRPINNEKKENNYKQKEHKSLMIKTIRKTFNKLSENKLIQDLIKNNNSEILNGILEEIGDQLIDIDFAKKAVKRDIEAIIINKRFFILTQLDFNVNENEIQNAINLVHLHCPNIFFHADISDYAADKALCIAKAYDIKNGIPLTLWLLDMYTEYRMSKHKQNIENNILIHNDDVAIDYNIIKWFDNDNIFCTYILYKWGSNVSNILKSALKSMIKRTLPTLNFMSTLTPKIYDNLNEFIKYTLALQHFILSFVNETNAETEYIFPL
eukprot:521540_1